jgi:hypothetical protein
VSENREPFERRIIIDCGGQSRSGTIDVKWKGSFPLGTKKTSLGDNKYAISVSLSAEDMKVMAAGSYEGVLTVTNVGLEFPETTRVPITIIVR